MKRLINLFLICFILIAGCRTGVKPSKIQAVKSVPYKELVITKRSEISTNVAIPPITPVERKTFLPIRNPKGQEKAALKPIVEQIRAVENTNTPAYSPATNLVQPPQKKKSNGAALVAYYSLVFGIGSIWFFYGRTKLKGLLGFLWYSRKK